MICNSRDTSMIFKLMIRVFMFLCSNIAHVKFGNAISLHFMTACRPDLSVDGTHYGIPLSIMMLDMWLHQVCG